MQSARGLSDVTLRRPLRPGRGVFVDLGHEPPLSRSGEEVTGERRNLSLRWLTATVLTGLFGAGLIGSAIVVSLDNEFNFAERGQFAQSSAQRASSPDRSPRRGDRLFVATDIVSAKQSFRTPTTIRIGDREVIKVKPFVRVATNLALSTLGFADEVPPFNPMKLYAAGGDTGERALEIEANEGDAEVSVQRRPLVGYAGAPDSGAVLDDDLVFAQVMEERRAALAAGQRGLAIPSQMMLMRALSTPRLQGEEPAQPDLGFSNMQVTFVPENVTKREKTPAPEQREGAQGPDEKLATIKRGETIEQVLRTNGANPAEAKSALLALGTKLRDTPPREGQRLKLLFGPASDGRRASPLLRAMLYDGETVLAIAAVNDRNEFVPVAPPQQETAARSTDEEEEDEEDGRGTGLRLYDSLYETGFKHDIPRVVIDQIVKVAFYDFDLQRRVSGGDSFEVFYGEDEENENRPEVLYASISVSGTLRRYYRFAPAEDGVIDFFDETGKSNRKFLVRKPISDGQLRSTFGMRYHPILRYSRMHTGIDWANRIGTPIIAAGDGRVRSAEWDSGYGRRIEIEHAYNFVTTYSHMSAFAKGIREGVRVRQGQVIGYLGNSGLSTGPHLHYEVMINENFVDPLAVKVPRNRDLDERQLASFRREKDRIDELIGKAPTATRLAGTR